MDLIYYKKFQKPLLKAEHRARVLEVTKTKHNMPRKVKDGLLLRGEDCKPETQCRINKYESCTSQSYYIVL
jgi:hypothetical protein